MGNCSRIASSLLLRDREAMPCYIYREGSKTFYALGICGASTSLYNIHYDLGEVYPPEAYDFYSTRFDRMSGCRLPTLVSAIRALRRAAVDKI